MLARIRHASVRRPLAWLANTLILAGSCGILFWLVISLERTSYQYVQRIQFDQSRLSGAAPGAEAPRQDSLPLLPQTLLSATRSVPAAARFLAPDPLVLGEMEIPSIGLSVIVRDGVDDATLRRAVGRLPSSALPGQPGNVVVLGHRDTFFRPLRNIERGDTIRIRTTGTSFDYVVESLQVTDPDWPPSIAAVPEPVVTLITCYPFTYSGPAPRRFVVRGRLVGSPDNAENQTW